MNDGTEQIKTGDEVIVVLPGGTKLPLTRRSIETGEFWLVVAIVASLVWLQATGKIPATLGTVAEVVIGLGMTWLRNHAKKIGGEQVIDVIEAAKTLPAPVVGAARDVGIRAGGVAATTLALLAGLMLTSCGTVVKERGQTVFYTPANAGHVDFKSPAGSRLVIDNLDHAIVHKAVGSAAAQGAAGVGAGVATSGLLGIFH